MVQDVDKNNLGHWIWGFSLNVGVFLDYFDMYGFIWGFITRKPLKSPMPLDHHVHVGFWCEYWGHNKGLAGVP